MSSMRQTPVDLRLYRCCQPHCFSGPKKFWLDKHSTIRNEAAEQDSKGEQCVVYSNITTSQRERMESN